MDLGSFYNISNQVAFDKLQSGIAGSIMPLRELGINLTVANMEAFMLSQGINATWDSLSEANKMIVRYNYIMTATNLAQGDFVKTQYSYANSVRQLSGAFAQLKSAVGTTLIGALTPIIKVLATIINYITVVFQWFNKLLGLFGGGAKGGAGGGGGISSPSIANGLGGVADGLDNVGGSAGGASDKVKDLKEELKGLMGIDEINKLNDKGKDSGSGGSSGGSGGGGGAGAGGIGDMDLDIKPINMDYFGEIESELDRIREKLRGWFEPIWNDMKDGVLQHIEELKKAFQNFKDSLSNLWKGIWNNGGKELAEELTRLGIVLFDVAVIVTTTLLNAFANFFNYINPETNTFTRGFLNAMTGLVQAVQPLLYALANAFQTFLNNGGQAFLNVMGDIIALVGTILARVLTDAIKLVTAFINSWMGQAIISAFAIALDLVAGAVKGVLIVIEKCIPLIEALALAFGAIYLTKIATDFMKTWSAIKTGESILNGMNTVGGKFAFTLNSWKVKLVENTKYCLSFAKNGLMILHTTLNTVGKKFTDFVSLLAKSFVTALEKSVNGLKKLITALKNPVQTFNALKTAIVSNVKAMGTWIISTGKSALTAIKNLSASIYSSIASFLGLSVAEGTATAGAMAFQVALDAIGIGLIIALVALLVKHFDKVVAVFKKLWESAKNLPIIGKLFEGIEWVVKKVADAVGWLWDKVKGFFGWKSDSNSIEDSFEDCSTACSDFGEEMKSTSDVFGNETSKINEYLNGINFNATKLGQQVEEATAIMDEQFSMLSGNAQEYLDAIVSHDEEKLAEMSENSGVCMEEIKLMYANLTEEAKNQFYAKYGYIEGINEDWLNLEGLTYDQLVGKHVAYTQNILNDESLTYQEKQRMIKEHEDLINKSWDDRITNIRNKMNEELAQEGLTEQERYRIRYEANQEINRLEDEKNKWTIDGINSVDEAVSTSADAQKNAYKGVSDEQKKNLEEVDKSLETTKTNLEDFTKSNENETKKITEAWSGIGKKISNEFKSIKTDVPNIFKSMTSQITASTTKLTSTIKSQFTAMSTAMKSSMTTASSNIKSVFTSMTSALVSATKSMSSQITNAINQMKSNTISSINNLKSSVISSFNNMSQSALNVINSMTHSIINAMNNLRNNLNNIVNAIKVNLETGFRNASNTVVNSFNGVADRLQAQFNDILSRSRSFAYSMNSCFSNIGASLGTSMAYNFRSAMNNVIARINNQVITLINRVSSINSAGVHVRNLPMLASGGIVNGATQAIIGEKGKEAVLPLDGNQKWMNDLAEKLASKMNVSNGGGDITVQVNLDGEKVATNTVRHINNQTKRSGNSPLIF